PGLERAMDVFVSVVHGQHDGSCLWVDLANGANGFHAAHDWKLQDHQHDIRPLAEETGDGFLAGRDGSDDGAIRLAFDDELEALSHDAMVVHDENANRGFC